MQSFGWPRAAGAWNTDHLTCMYPQRSNVSMAGASACKDRLAWRIANAPTLRFVDDGGEVRASNSEGMSNIVWQPYFSNLTYVSRASRASKTVHLSHAHHRTNEVVDNSKRSADSATIRCRNNGSFNLGQETGEGDGTFNTAVPISFSALPPSCSTSPPSKNRGLKSNYPYIPARASLAGSNST